MFPRARPPNTLEPGLTHWLYQGMVELLRHEWKWPPPAATGSATLDGDVLLVARIEAPSLWSSQEGRKEAREGILVMPLYGRDRRGGGK